MSLSCQRGLPMAFIKDWIIGKKYNLWMLQQVKLQQLNVVEKKKKKMKLIKHKMNNTFKNKISWKIQRTKENKKRVKDTKLELDFFLSVKV